MNGFIDLLCCYTRLTHRMTQVDGLSRYSTCLSQLFEIFFISDNWRCLICKLLEMGIWLPSLCIVWLLHWVRYFTMSFETIWERSERAFIKSIVLLYFRFLVSKLVELPKASEAFLTTKVGWFKLKFDAGWALHRGNICTVWCSTCSLFWLWKFFLLFFIRWVLLFLAILCFLHLSIYN